MQTTPSTPVLERVPLREKFSYALGDIGSNLVFAPATSFILFYFTDVAGIGAAIAGTVVLVGQLMNGVVDLVVGGLIDKTSTRWGKTRPWILWSAPPLMVSFVLLFSVPAGLDDTGKVIWALVLYTLVMAVFFTASNVAYSALLSVMTVSPKTRVTLTTFRFFAAVLTTLVVNYATLPLIGALGGGQGAWTGAMTVYAVIGLVTLIAVFLGTKERVQPESEAHSSKAQPMKKLLKQLFKNHYFWLSGALFVCFYLLSGLSQGAGVYYATVILGDAGLFGIISLATLLPPLIGIGFMPAILGRFGKRRSFLVGIGVQLLGGIVMIVAPEDFTVVLVGLIIRGIGSVPFTAGLFAIVADVVDYGEWKFGTRIDGLTYSAVVFGQKVGAGLGTAAIGWILATGSYDGTLTTQPESAVTAIQVAFLYIPIVIMVITAVVIFFLNVEKHGPQIADFFAARSANRDAAGPAESVPEESTR